MKKHYLFIALVIASLSLNAQTVSTFENITLSDSSYRDGTDPADKVAKGFSSGNAFFNNYVDSSQFGEYWIDGFAISNRKDSTTNNVSDYTKQYTAITGGGYNGSSNYAIGAFNSVIRLSGNALGKQPDGVYVTNSNYTYLAMKYGDGFARAFTDTDYFYLDFIGYKGGVESDTAVRFYLANGRSLVNDWKWVNLQPLEDADSIVITLRSTDIGTSGMNTPAYFCIDNFTTRDFKTSLVEDSKPVNVVLYPNPVSSVLNIDAGTQDMIRISILDIAGKVCINGTENQVDVSTLSPGMYLLQVETATGISVKRFHKN